MGQIKPDQRMEVTRLLMAMLDRWKVATADQVTLLGLPTGTKPRTLKRYHDDTPLPDSDEINERIEHLIGIADALRTSYPLNSEMTGFWLNQDNQRFEGRKPIDIMIHDGLDGLTTIRAHLDCAWDWHRDDKDT